MNPCIDPTSAYDNIGTLKECFDNGYKLASLQSTSILHRSSQIIPDEWIITDTSGNVRINGTGTILIFANEFIADMFRSVSEHYYELIDIIHGFFFGYCIFDIAQYCFIHENDHINMTIEIAVEKLRDGTLTERDLINLIKKGAFKKKEEKLETVFNNIFIISTFLYNEIQRNSQYFDMNCHAVRNIRNATLLDGFCTL